MILCLRRLGNTITAMNRPQIILPAAFDFELTLPVRLTDLNYGNHLANDRVLALVHEARVAWLHTQGLTELDLGEGVGLIQADAAVRYLSQARWGDTLRLQLAVAEMRRGGFTLAYRISHAASDQDVAHVQTGFAFFDYARQQVARGPQAFTTRWARE
ncbi:MAG: thioesterase family protein [Verrucomicrobiota bacterium JB022]|nr:thioesterase family protein [Verrucomicrobiota bacterium JB022]